MAVNDHTPDDIAEKVTSALAAYASGSLVPLAVLTGEGAPDGAPFVLIRPEDTTQAWRLRIEGPLDIETPEGIAAAAVAFGYADPDPWVPGFQYAEQGPASVRGEFRPCADCRTPITCEESEEDRCP